jgi:hypothetical protein
LQPHAQDHGLALRVVMVQGLQYCSITKMKAAA